MSFKKGFMFSLGALAVLLVIAMVVGVSMAADTTTEDKEKKTITVSGSGYVYAKPDVAVISVGVVTESKTSTDAMDANNDKMNQVISAVKALGIPERDIQTGTVSLQPKYEEVKPDYTYYSYVRNIVGYTATNTVTIKVRDMTKVGPAIDAAYRSGSNQINGVSFTMSEDLYNKLYNDALKMAVNVAGDKAKTIADTAGISGIRLNKISESGSYQPVYYDSWNTRAGAADLAAAPTPVEPGQQKVTASVSMEYTFV